MNRRLKPQPDPDKDRLERRAGYIVHGELLLTDYEWAHGDTPDVKQLTARRREAGLSPIPEKVDVARVQLAVRAPIRAKVEQSDMADTPLFGQMELL